EDPKPAIDEACAQSHHCHGLKARFDACTAKLEAGNGAQDETCVEEFFDLM
ncbi:uncharacterized protein EV422DRAFT_478806, partial [Fimicolochytrium jonesii]|uniref:uncharacterized protein n=1 Tax=Fimicolochytrium jonesii TaxID=1396493 RepID=UPI0022FDFFA2